FEDRALVVRALVHMRDAEIGGASQHDGRFARADDGGDDAGVLQQLDAVAVEHVEGFHHFAVGTEVQAAVGEYAIDVEDHHPHIRCAGGGIRRGGRNRRRHQITFARVRSWICSAPTSVPFASVTNNWLMRNSSISSTASTASCSGCTLRGL